MENHSLAVASYEPRPQMPLTLRPITTPGNNPAAFAQHQKLLRTAALAANGRDPPQKAGIILPGSELTSVHSAAIILTGCRGVWWSKHLRPVSLRIEIRNQIRTGLCIAPSG